MPQFLQTTGDRLHDYELDDLLRRLAALEAQVAALTPQGGSSSQVSKAVGAQGAAVGAPLAAPSNAPTGVSSITPGSGTPMSGTLLVAASGALTLAQSNQALTLAVPFATATPAALGTAAVGSSAKLAREDHVHPTIGLVTTVNGSSGAITVPASLNGLTGAINIISGGGCTVSVVGNNVQISVP